MVTDSVVSFIVVAPINMNYSYSYNADIEENITVILFKTVNSCCNELEILNRTTV